MMKWDVEERFSSPTPMCQENNSILMADQIMIISHSEMKEL